MRLPFCPDVVSDAGEILLMDVECVVDVEIEFDSLDEPRLCVGAVIFDTGRREPGRATYAPGPKLDVMCHPDPLFGELGRYIAEKAARDDDLLELALERAEDAGQVELVGDRWRMAA
jgi:hypothetical protein